MTIVVTEWALQSYLDLVHKGVFTTAEYWSTIRPDVEKLNSFPHDPAFQNSNFWGPATDQAGRQIADGYKMKWHNIGPGRVQLRGADAIINSHAYLCQAYVKDSDATDKRNAAKLKMHIRNIHLGRVQVRGVLP